MEKPFGLFVTSKTQTELFVGKTQIDNFGALFVENKDWTRAEPYKHTTWIPRWKDVETAFSTSFQRGIHVVCL